MFLLCRGAGMLVGGVMTSRDYFGLAILLVQFCLAVPLIWRLVRSAVRTGYSVVGEAVWIFGALGWLAYGVGVGSVPLILSGVLASVTSFLVTVLSWGDAGGRERGSALWGSLATLVGCGVPALVWGLAGLSVALSVFGAVQFIPQILKTLRSWEGVLSGAVLFGGVSVFGSVMRSLYAFSWAFYAGAWLVWGVSFGEIDWPLVAWGFAGTGAFGLQAVLAYKYFRRPGEPTEPVPVIVSR